MSQKLTCEQLLAYLSDYIDNNLPEELIAAAEEHLATCVNCSVVLSSTQKTILLFRKRGQNHSLPADRQHLLYKQLSEAYKKRHHS